MIILVSFGYFVPSYEPLDLLSYSSSLPQYCIEWNLLLQIIFSLTSAYLFLHNLPGAKNPFPLRLFCILEWSKLPSALYILMNWKNIEDYQFSKDKTNFKYYI